MFDLVIYICLRKYWNFQSEAKVEQIIAIVTARSVSCFCCYCYYFYPLFLSHAKAIISITHWENGLVHVTNKNTAIYAILYQFTAILCQKYLFWTIKETFFWNFVLYWKGGHFSIKRFDIPTFCNTLHLEMNLY